MIRLLLRLGLAFASGVLFAVGLALAGMTNPAKVAAFLDFTGDWDPSLAFVMIGAIGVYTPLQFLIRRRARPVLASGFELPTRANIDARLLGGAALFGLGWGALGFCPGPAVASLGVGGITSLLFVTGMLVAMGLFQLWRGRSESRKTARESESHGRRAVAHR